MTTRRMQRKGKNPGSGPRDHKAVATSATQSKGKKRRKAEKQGKKGSRGKRQRKKKGGGRKRGEDPMSPYYDALLDHPNYRSP